MFGEIRMNSLAPPYTQTNKSTEMDLLGWSQLKKRSDFGILRPCSDNRHEIGHNADIECPSSDKCGKSDKVTGLLRHTL